MNRREQILAVVAACAVLGWLGLPQLHAVFIAPIEEKQAELDVVSGELDAAARTLSDITRASVVMKRWRGRSLPPNPLDAQRHYQAWLTDLAQLVSFEDLKVSPGRTAAQGSAFTGVQVVLEGKARMSHVGEFLYHFYRTDLPHRIVSMNIQCPEAEGDPVLSVTLTAEGLAIRGAPRREHLFATASLTDGFMSNTSAQQIEVDEADTFPDATPLRIRIGNEYLAVTGRDGNHWTVEGGRDSTSPASHEAGDAVELAPVWPGYAEFSLEDFRELVGASPFVKPALPVPPKGREQVVRDDDAVKDTYLAASILTSDQPSAWLYRRSKSQRTVIHKQSQLDVGELHAIVLDIQADHVLIRADDATWRLRMGDSLSTMQRLPSDTVDAPPDNDTSVDEDPGRDEAATDVSSPDDAGSDSVTSSRAQDS